MIERVGFKAIAIIVAAAIVIGCIGFAVWRWQHSANVETRVQTGQAGAGMNSTEAAFNTMDAAVERDAETDTTVRAGKAAIDQAPIGKRNAAAIKAACSLPAYKDTPKCHPKP